MSQSDFSFTLWDVGHGLCVWIQTPNGQNHWIDCKKTDDFSPSEHVKNKFGVTKLDYLIISHPDLDHISDLCNLVKAFGQPHVLHRNKTLPDTEKFKSGMLECQTIFKNLDTSYTQTVIWEKNPRNPEVNGGIEIIVGYNDYSQEITGNNTSLVALYHYAGWLFACPGDIEDTGWKKLWSVRGKDFEPLINKSKWRVLVAPHHGRSSGFSQAMMDNIRPDLVIISDVHGQSETDRRFRENPQGLKIIVAPESETKLCKYISTKGAGRVRFDITNTGIYKAHQYEYWQ
jgi:beta-lactamase superfamily II metal-dependent hydrolase